jgi:hypothetical protein
MRLFTAESEPVGRNAPFEGYQLKQGVSKGTPGVFSRSCDIL